MKQRKGKWHFLARCLTSLAGLAGPTLEAFVQMGWWGAASLVTLFDIYFSSLFVIKNSFGMAGYLI